MPGYWDLWALWGKGKQERTESLGNTVRPWPGPHWLVVQKPTALGFRARPYLLFLSRATRVVIPSLQFPDLQLSGSPALSPPSSLPSWSSSGTSSGWVRCGRVLVPRVPLEGRTSKPGPLYLSRLIPMPRGEEGGRRGCQTSFWHSPSEKGELKRELREDFQARKWPLRQTCTFPKGNTRLSQWRQNSVQRGAVDRPAAALAIIDFCLFWEHQESLKVWSN